MQWRYIPTSLNPSDILSRGMKTANLIDCDRWWTGPEFLRKSEVAWPTKVINDKHTGYDEMKRSGTLQKANPTILTRKENSLESVFIAVTDNEENFPLRPRNYSSLLRLKRVLAWVNRFVDNCRKQKEYRTSGELLSDELKRAEVQLIRPPSLQSLQWNGRLSLVGNFYRQTASCWDCNQTSMTTD